MSEIAKWFYGRSVFITGATGLVGKSLVEKLLRDCPDIRTIYLLLRGKKGMSSAQRAANYKNQIAFTNLREKQPEVLDKLHFIEGDLIAPNLGISESDRKLLAQDASVIFHVAASVQFDLPLTEAYQINVSGTKAALDFAIEFKQLDVFLYVSTAFSQPNTIGTLEEKYYPSTIDLNLMESFVKNIDTDVLSSLSSKIMGKHPNTYAFSKSLSEQLVYDYKDKFPTAIARPSIIISAWKEPLPGYTEGLQGLNGWSMAGGRGVLRSMHCNGKQPSNVIQNDIVVNGIIILAYECAKQHQHRLETFSEYSVPENTKSNEPIYFNISDDKPSSWNTHLNHVLENYWDVPFDFSLGYPGGSLKTSRFYNFICVVLFQLIPAILIDLILLLMGRKPLLVYIQRRVVLGCDALNHFANNVFKFKSDKYKEAHARLNKIDRDIFYDNSMMSLHEFIKVGALGARRYLMKEKDENLPRAKKIARILYTLDVIMKIWLTYWLFKKFLGFFNVTVY